MKRRVISRMIVCSVMAAIMFTTSACGGKGAEEKIEESTVEQGADEMSEITPEAAQKIKAEEIPEATPEAVPEITPDAIPETIQEESQEPELELCQVVHCNEFITLRAEPSTSGAEICKIPLGSDVYYMENAENGFVKIQYDGQEGYSLASYLNFTKEEGAIFMKVYNCQESITLRKIPSTKAEEFCQIPLGEKVIFRESAENGFYMVSYNGYTGYALAEYLIEW